MQRGVVHITFLIFMLFLAVSAIFFVQTKTFKQRTQNVGPTSSTSAEITASPTPEATSTPTPTSTSSPKTPKAKTYKVFLLIYNPVLESFGSKKLTEYKTWNNPVTLTKTFIDSVKQVSGGQIKYEITQQMEIDGYPIKADGFQYNDDSYLNCINSPSNCHVPDLSDYKQMIEVSGACDRINQGGIDELWIWGGPYFGYWESNLAGPGAFWYNSPPTLGTNCNKLLPVMGFNYERGEAEMFEDLAHRLESTMTRVYGSWSANETHDWNKFSLLDVDAPGRGGCGNAHLAVNASSNQGYERESTRSVQSRCDDFLNYPNLSDNFSSVSCTNWGCSTLGYFKWWFSHLPKADGALEGKLNNWWKYLLDPSLAL